jgi:hypothetical protein
MNLANMHVAIRGNMTNEKVHRTAAIAGEGLEVSEGDPGIALQSTILA